MSLSEKLIEVISDRNKSRKNKSLILEAKLSVGEEEAEDGEDENATMAANVINDSDQITTTRIV